MTRIDTAAAPPVRVPLAFFHAVPAWGLVAGTLLCVDGAVALSSRWAPSTLALVHALTLGVLGNAMIGAVLQFLPAAAGVRLQGPSALARLLHVALNGGALALVAGFRSMRPALLGLGATMLCTAFAIFACMTLPSLHRRLHNDPTRGIAGAITALLVAAGLGAAMVARLVGFGGLAPPRWADAHATWGLVGGVLGLLVAVAHVVVPMFQAVPVSATRGHRRITFLFAIAAPATTWPIAVGQTHVARLAIATVVAAWALPALMSQLRAPWRRGRPLRLAWSIALAAMLASAVSLVAGIDALLIGALVLGLAAPLPVIAMLLEITAFIGWIHLQRSTPRGGRVPPVQTLQPEHLRLLVVAGIACAGVLAGVAAVWPSDASVRAAGGMLLLAHAALLAALHRLQARQRDVLRAPSPPGRHAH